MPPSPPWTERNSQLRSTFVSPERLAIKRHGSFEFVKIWSTCFTEAEWRLDGGLNEALTAFATFVLFSKAWLRLHHRASAAIPQVAPFEGKGSQGLVDLSANAEIGTP